MGCFLACFGFSKKRRRGKWASKVLSADHGLGSYKPLDFDVSIKLDTTKKNPNESDPQFSNKGKERSSLARRKKVSFNLNVKTYEPLPKYEFTSYLSESEEEKEEEKCEDNKEETVSSSKMGPIYPVNHRYQNCRDSYDEDEEDGIKLEESDLDEDEEEEEEEEDDDIQISQEEEFSEQFCLSLDQELKKLELNQKKVGRDRSQYVFSVLNPVENLTQWKAMKARARAATPPLKQQQQMKENKKIALEEEQRIPLVTKSSSLNFRENSNQSSPLIMPDIAIDASLSNWLMVSSNKESSITRD